VDVPNFSIGSVEGHSPLLILQTVYHFTLIPKAFPDRAATVAAGGHSTLSMAALGEKEGVFGLREVAR
jgi:hypothetical protein